MKIVGVLLRAALAEKQRNMMKHNSTRQAGQRGLREVVGGKKKCCCERRLGRTSVIPLSNFTNTHACEKRTISNLCVGVRQQQSRASPQKSDRSSCFALTTMMASSLRKQKKKKRGTHYYACFPMRLLQNSCIAAIAPTTTTVEKTLPRQGQNTKSRKWVF